MKLPSASETRQGSDEQGTTMLLVAASMFLLIAVAAIAIDLGGLRFDIRTDQLATDASATAGVASINPFAGSAADVACSVAWEYLLLNVSDEGPVSVPPDCTVFSGACDPTVTRRTNALADPYSVTITHPVLDGDPLMAGQAINSAIDGTPCQRLGVELTRTRDFAFGGVLGAGSGDTTVATVARIGAGTGEGEVVPLLVLEPVACDALYTSGQGGVTVGYFNDTPGFIVVDSNGSKTTNPNRCGNNSWTIDVKGATQGWIRAVPTPTNIPSAILSYALSGVGSAVPTHSYDASDLLDGPNCDPSDPPGCRRLYPEPMAISDRITRAPIDWRYNCKATYPDYLGIVPILPCPDTSAPHIDNLISAYSAPGDPTAFGFFAWSNLYDCEPDADITAPAGRNWWIDCDRLYLGAAADGSFVDVVIPDGNIITKGDIDVGAGATLTINGSDASDVVMYVRSGGDLAKVAQAGITLNRTFVLLEDGIIDLVGGAVGVNWTAPLSGDFEDLALWSESSLQHELGGQSGNDLTGTFFTPQAEPFVLTGQSGQFQTSAQFLTRRLEVKSQGEVRMEPDPDRQTLIPIREVRLIR